MLQFSLITDGAVWDSGSLLLSKLVLSTQSQGRVSAASLLSKERTVESAALAGFVYHHAEPGYVMLTFWLPDRPPGLPSTSLHQIGVGAFVMNDKNEVLVKEGKCPSHCSDIWKIPTSFIDKFEDLFSGAIREVREETGIESCFLDVVAFRHAHQALFDKSDILFICTLKPLSFDISMDESEIEAARWMPISQPTIPSGG